MRVEDVLLSDEPLAGFSLDYAKCFDKAPIRMSSRLAEEAGMSENILRGL